MRQRFQLDRDFIPSDEIREQDIGFHSSQHQWHRRLAGHRQLSLGEPQLAGLVIGFLVTPQANFVLNRKEAAEQCLSAIFVDERHGVVSRRIQGRDSIAARMDYRTDGKAGARIKAEDN